MHIQIEKVKKFYGAHEALKGINLTIETGMFGLLGPNGAGKTTLLRMLATLLQPSDGRILMGSFDLSRRAERKAVRDMLGYLPQDFDVYPELTGWEFLDYMGLLKGCYERKARRQQIASLLKSVNLDHVAHRKIETYSGGMKRRLGLLQALLGNPEVLVIDEPTAGLDPEERIRLRNLLTRLAEERIVILSTHVVEDITQTCEQLAVLDQGQISFHGATHELIQRADGHVWQFLASPRYQPGPQTYVISALPQRDGVLYRIVGPRPQGEGRAVQAVSSTLEDSYIWLRQAKKENQNV